MESWQHWDDFLKVISRDHELELTEAEAESFLLQFARENIGKSLEEVATLLPQTANPLANHKKRMSEVYDEFSKICPNLKSEKHKLKPLLKCLEDKYFQWLPVKGSDSALPSATDIDWHGICQAMLNNPLNNQRRLTSNYLLHENEDDKFEREQIYVPLALVPDCLTHLCEY